MRLVERPLTRPLAELLAQPPGDSLRLYWLGQAGFVLDGEGRRVVIDPYLSDSLAEKYRGKKFPHLRMTPAPLHPAEIRHVDLVLATHGHSDHLDPGTLPTLLAANPAALLVAPLAIRSLALERAAVPEQRLVCIDAGETVTLSGLHLSATRAAHETFERDPQGHYRFLGLAVRLAEATVFHSGDTIPFAGQVEEVRALAPDIALLPVNGRDALRTENGIPGNMTLSEATALARATGVGAMIAHHFDLFAFNTVARSDIEAACEPDGDLQILAATPMIAYLAQVV